MTGVEILVMNQIVVDTRFDLMSAGGMFGIAFGLFILGGLIASLLYDDWWYMRSLIFAGIIFGIVFGLIVGFCDGIPTEYETHYKVVISDEVFMNEFLERYEILDQEGKIYTVREREGVEDDNGTVKEGKRNPKRD
jgi:hypothetical protein